MKLVFSIVAVGIGILGLISFHRSLAHKYTPPGMRVYIAEGCMNCHSQYSRPHSKDLFHSGPISQFNEPSGQAVLIGNRRQGPDLSNIGVRRSREWNRQHLLDPQAISPGSRMPAYPHLFDAEKDSQGEMLLDYLESLVSNDIESWWNTVYNWTPKSFRTGDAVAGQCLFSQSCAQCHGNDAKGQGLAAPHFKIKPANLVEGPYRLVPREMPETPRKKRLAQIIKYGQAGTSMPGHEYLTDQNVIDLMTFLDTLSQ